MGEVIAFIVGAVFGVLSTCLIAAGRRGDDIQNMSIKQRNVSEYPEYEYSDTKNRNAADMIRETPAVNQRHCAWLDTAERLRRMTAKEYLIEKMRSDADGQKDS